MPETSLGRRFTREAFDQAYDKVILGNSLVEHADYYRIYRARYRRSLEYFASLPLPPQANLLEVGGGQLVMLAQSMFGDHATVTDVSDEFSEAVTKFGFGFRSCDLLRDDLEDRDAFDAVILLEVVEHLPVPLHLVLEKVKRWIKPGGWLFLTTPNLYRLRNIVRLALGMEVFCPLFYPEPGSSIGHPFEFSAEHLRWQIERAGFQDLHLEHVQLTNRGSSLLTQAARVAISPLLLRPRWRDGLVAWAQRPESDRSEERADGSIPGLSDSPVVQGR